MGRVILITGGSRSGKSAYAQGLAESQPGPRVFVATCPVLDNEMRGRIRRHQQARAAGQWQTIEETTDLAGALIRAADANVVLVDCLTLWVNNLMYHMEQQGRELQEDDIAARCQAVLAGTGSHRATIIFVTNEVGLGIIPDNALARRFRDLAGRCNQTIAAGADEVTLLVSGLPLSLKRGGRPCHN